MSVSVFYYIDRVERKKNQFNRAKNVCAKIFRKRLSDATRALASSVSRDSLAKYMMKKKKNFTSTQLTE
jgi:hypothetical protein